MEEITIRKSTAYLVVGLVMAVVFGAYIAFSSPGPTSQGAAAVSDSPSGAPAQDIYIKALSNGAYDKPEVSVKKGVPVRLHFTAEPNAGCGRQFVIFGMNVNAISRSGEEDIVEFTPQQAGTFEYSCGMRMWGPGKLIVV